jgi:hypothetical protein
MPGTRRFDVVALRAVDDMETALPAAIARITPGGQLAVLTTKAKTPVGASSILVPNSQSGVLWLQTIPK